jgi:putative ABC transport system permease protein
MASPLELGARLLLHDKRRLIAMALGVAVGVVIMFVQVGLLQGILDSQSLEAKLVQGDLMVMNRARIDLHHWDAVKPYELAQVAAVPGVASMIPVYKSPVGFEDPDDKRVRRIILYAFPPDAQPLKIGDPKKVAQALRASNAFLFDERSRPIFGVIKPGMSIAIDKGPLNVSGLAHMGPDIVNDGAIFVSEGAWLSRDPGAYPIMGVVRLAPGASLTAVRAAIEARTPGDVAAFTPAEAARRETSSTLREAPIGLLFGVGAIAGLLIGVINGYQVLYTEVSDHLAQYATMKAMGFADAFLHRIILAQAAVLSAAGFAVGLPLAIVVDVLVALFTRLPVEVHVMTAAGIGLAALLASTLAGRLAMRRVDAADPASLY